MQRPVAITGTTTTPVVSVQINQQQAQLSPDGRSFTFPTYFLHEGANHISAVATDAHGRSASDQITVYVDQTAPLLTVESPIPDTVTSLRRIDVRGLVNDAVQAPVETAVPRVRVRNSANGSEVEAVVAGLGYVAEDVPLEVGLNRLEVIAQDQHGNSRSRTVELVRTLAGSGRLVALGGNRQSGLVGSALPQPLLVQAFDAEGQPLAGVPVHLDIVRGSGSLHGEAAPAPAEGANPPRNLVHVTDAEGLAQAWLHLGVDARPGSDVVRGWSPGMAEEVMFSATAEAGSPHSVHVYGSSGTQYVATGSTPIEALMVQVQDAQRNPVPGTQVEFRIDSGEARFSERSAPAGVVSNDGRTLTVRADRNGIAVVRPQAGESAETVRVQSEALTDDGERIGPVGFHLVVLDRQDGATRLAGKVLDHSGTPLAGVRLSIGRTALSVLSDENGDFEFTGQVPVGKVDLFVDGRDLRVNRSGSPHEYPALHFETSVVQGQLNQLPHPIYLPPIDLARAQTVGGDEEVTLTLPGFEGFEMRVKPNSVTFPDGSRVGPLVIAPVHNDRLPMVPLAAAGRFETVGWTIQPTNTRFDPPIEVRIPNTSGLRPGQTLPIQQWDHDLALFVPMGNGTVSEDGTQIISDPGSGITKAGWGGGPPPPPPDNCGTDGEDPVISSLTTEAFGIVPNTDEPVFLLYDGQGAMHVNKGLRMREETRNCPSMQYGWELSNGQRIEGVRELTARHFSEPGTYSARPFVECRRSVCQRELTADREGDPAKLHVVGMELISAFGEQTQNPQANGWTIDAEGPSPENATGYADRPYALMGVREDNSGCVRIQLNLEGGDEGIAKVRERLLFKFREVPWTVYQKSVSGPGCGESGTFEGDALFLSLNAPPFAELITTFGIDDDQDGELARSEVVAFKPRWRFLMVSDQSRAVAVEEYNRGVAARFGPLAVNWLTSFRDGTIPGVAASVDESFTVARNAAGLSHANGLRFASGPWDPEKRGASRRVTHAPGSFVVRALRESRSMRAWLYDGVRAHRDEIVAAVSGSPDFVEARFIFSNLRESELQALNFSCATSVDQKQMEKLTFLVPDTEGVGLLPPDLYAVVGDTGAIALCVQVGAYFDASRNRHVVGGITILNGVVEDLFDWDYDIRLKGIPLGLVPYYGPLAQGGAKLQATHLGKASSRRGAMVFQSVYQFGEYSYVGFSF